MGWDGMPLAYRLQEEGCDVMVGQVQSKKELGQEETEDEKEKETRLKQYENLLDIVPADKLIESLKKLNNKEEYFILFDQNNLYPYAEELLAAGFTQGLFPTKEDYTFERDREAAMKFVENNYPDIKIINYEEFSTVPEAIAFLKGSQRVMVIQSKGDFVSTMVPQTDDIEKEREQMINHLERNKADFEKGGIILKDKLIHPIEITPQIMFYNGKVIFTDLDLETKNIGEGENNGDQTGCGSNLIIKTKLGDRINEIAFPAVIYSMAKERKGMFVWDISIYLTDEGMYFGEFCANRLGYDACMTEMEMSKGTHNYFSKITQGENPLEFIFGAAIRLFNLRNQKDREVIWDKSIDSHIWMYDIYGDVDKKKMSAGSSWDLGVVTAAANTIEEAVENLYTYASKISFKELYKKTKKDFLGMYPTSILFRFMQTNHNLFNVEDYKPIDNEYQLAVKEKEMESNISGMRRRYEGEISSIKTQLGELASPDDDGN